MWIEDVEIGGFKRLHGLPLRFSPGLTLVLGDNEAGKSSLHEALIRALFGFSKAERRRTAGKSHLERCAPWQTGRPYRLTATVQEARGRSWRIEWDFSNHEVRLLDAVTGEDRSTEVPRIGGDDVLGEYLLGIGLEDFREVCCLSQVEVGSVKHSDSLTNALQQAVASAGSDVLVDDAIERLKAFVSGLGLRTDTYKPNVSGQAARLIAERERLRTELDSCMTERGRIAELAVELAECRRNLDELQGDQERIRQQLLLTELQELEGRLEEARAQEKLARDKPERSTWLPQETVSAIGSASDAIDRVVQPIADLETEIHATKSQLAELKQQRSALVAKVDGLDVYASTDVGSEAAARETWGQLRELLAEADAPPPQVPERDPLLARYRAERDDLIRLGAEALPHHPRLWRGLWIAFAVLTLGLAVLGRRAIRDLRRRFGRTSQLAERLAAYGAASVAELDAHLAEEDRAVASAEAVAQTLDVRRQERERRRIELERTLAATLDEAATPAAESLEQRVTAYLTACERHAERQSLELRLADVNAQVDRLTQPATDLRRQVDQRNRRVVELRDLYESLGIDASDLVAAAAALAERERAEEGERQRLLDAQAAQRALQALLGEQTMADLERRSDAAGRTHRRHVDDHGELATEPAEKEALQVRLDEIGVELQGIRERVTQLQTRIEEGERDLPEPGELEEQLDALNASLERIEITKDAVRLARETLSAAAAEVHREFAPYLNEALRRNLPRITNGRYAEAVVNDQLEVRVVAPETGLSVAADELSRATQDQIFLVQRLEIARLLDPTTGAAPLFLDDPFAHFDPKRLQLGLELLREIADERQVILFSEDPSLVEQAQRVCPGCGRIDLPTPTERAASQPGVSAASDG